MNSEQLLKIAAMSDQAEAAVRLRVAKWCEDGEAEIHIAHLLTVLSRVESLKDELNFYSVIAGTTSMLKLFDEQLQLQKGNQNDE